jgi:tagatose-1,6-bisphosphate aldolase non-catalytic subunit AgaZ/GatZ
MNKFQILYDSINQNKTLLGIGPMSWLTIDSVVEIANERRIPLLLIASRRQVDSKSLGGGYVTDTETLACYVREKGNFVFLCRDHGGPWQGEGEADLSYNEAMRTAKISYEEDIAAGFEIIHIDPALRARPLPDVLSDAATLYDFCEKVAAVEGKEIIYEVGTEEHSQNSAKMSDFEIFVDEISKLPKVKFVVGNTGLYVKELRNVGYANTSAVSELANVCKRKQLMLKAHNSDYLDRVTIGTLRYCGVNAINIAPELGTLESKTMIHEYRKQGQFDLADRFIQIAYESGKWFKWMIDPTNPASREYRALIAGHYVLRHKDMPSIQSTYRFQEACQNAIKERIEFYLTNLGW